MSRPLPQVIRTIAIVEAGKGLIALCASAGLLLARKDMLGLLGHFFRVLQLDPASHYPRLIAQAAGRVSERDIFVLTLLAWFYALVRGLEAWWLWRQRPWAEWFALGSTAFYLPVEVYEINRAPTWPLLTVFAVNLAIVIYLALVLRSRMLWVHSALARG